MENENQETTTVNSEMESNDAAESNSVEEQAQGEAKAKAENESKKESMLRKFKLKVDGEEIEEELDLADEQALIKKLQLASAAQKRMAEAQEAKKKSYELAKMLDSDPAGFIKRLGDKGYKIAEDLLLEKIKREMMTPEQIELEELRQFKQMQEAKLKEAAELEEKQKQEAIERKYAEEFQKTIIGALEKSGLPKTPEVTRRMAYLMKQSIGLGLDLSAEELAYEARKDYEATLKSLTKDADIESVLNLVGPDLAKKIRKYDLGKLKEKQASLGTKPITHASMPKTTKQNYQSMDDWKRELEERMKSLKD